MAGTIVADTLTHSTAGSLTTDYVVNGSAKAWVSLNGTGTAAIRDSHNTSSITDAGTGVYYSTFSSAMNNASFSGGSHVIGLSNGDLVATGEATAPTTTTFRVGCRTVGGTLLDPEYAMTNVHGDLA